MPPKRKPPPFVKRGSPVAFMQAIFQGWISAMTGALTIPLSVLALYWPAEEIRPWFWALCAFSLVVACYAAWAHERSLRIAQLEDRPKIEISIKKASEAFVDDEFGLLLSVSVSNGGSPGALSGWQIEFVDSDGNAVVRNVARAPRKIEIPHGSGLRALAPHEMLPTDGTFLFEKAKFYEGWLVFPKVAMAVDVKDANVTLRCRDAWAQVWEAVKMPGSLRS